MAVLADLETLVAEGILTPAQARILQERSRVAMVTLVINLLLAGGVLASAAGLVVWLGDPLTVALAGLGFLVGGAALLLRGPVLWRMFGHAAALIGAGMLMGGGVVRALEIFTRAEAGGIFAAVGLLLAAASGAWVWRGDARLRLLSGFLLLAGAALHLGGLYLAAAEAELGGGLRMLFSLYAALAIALLGWALDFRPVTALAILPFAQILDMSGEYFHAAYGIYSPEPTLSIVQMAVAIGFCLWLIPRADERVARHAGIFAVMAFVVLNLCFFIGSLWGDVVGESYMRDRLLAQFPQDWQARRAGFEAFKAQTLEIPEQVFAVVWALVLAAVAVFAARALNRGLFNTALTFGAIHAYAQAYESFGDEPLAWVIGGMAAIPLAWGIWRLNQQLG